MAFTNSTGISTSTSGSTIINSIDPLASNSTIPLVHFDSTGITISNDTKLNLNYKKVYDKLEEVKENSKEDNKDILDALAEIRGDIAELYSRLDKDKIENIRGEILNFADSIHAGDNHSREQYHRIVERNIEYHKLIEKYDMKNGVLDLAMEVIMKSYQEHEDKDDFI